MKGRIRLLQTSIDPRFAHVARIIAKGKPPAWLAIGLEQFSGFVGSERPTSDQGQRFQNIFERMHYATGILIEWLPLFENLPAGFECPDDVAIALDVLPRIKKGIAGLMQDQRGGGPRPNIQRRVCAEIVVEAWYIVHGKPEPRSLQLQSACNAYWLACGGEDRGSDIENWRRDAERAVAKNRGWIREALTALKAKAVHN